MAESKEELKSLLMKVKEELAVSLWFSLPLCASVKLRLFVTQ